ncbi:MAG TPA: hypothetical protein VM328_03220 [Fimbriimonadaceae bacterium]|nr:hypothetical protein [Fimbriimonadaceae bacterium]
MEEEWTELLDELAERYPHVDVHEAIRRVTHECLEMMDAPDLIEGLPGYPPGLVHSILFMLRQSVLASSRRLQRDTPTMVVHLRADYWPMPLGCARSRQAAELWLN